MIARCGGPAICPKCATEAGTIHAQVRDPQTARLAELAAARREGWVQAIEALRDDRTYREWYLAKYPGGRPPVASRLEAAAYLTDRTAALTEEPE